MLCANCFFWFSGLHCQPRFGNHWQVLLAHVRQVLHQELAPEVQGQVLQRENAPDLSFDQDRIILEDAAEACSGEGCKLLLLMKILSQLHYEYFRLNNFNELQEQDPRDHSTRLLSSKSVYVKILSRHLSYCTSL